MDPKFRSSFIPKKPLATGQEARKQRKRRSFDVMGLISALIFIGSVAASAGAYGYAFVLEDQVNQKGIELASERSNLHLDQIDDYKLLDARLKIAWSLLRGHVVTASFFKTLEDMTLHNVQFDSYTFEQGQDDTMTITMKGRTTSFNSLALQEDLFERESMLQDVQFSEFKLMEDGLQFAVTASFDPAAVAYFVEEAPTDEETTQ